MKPLQQLLLNAKDEILELRRRNEVLAAQVAVVEVFAAALRPGSNGHGQTFGWQRDVVGALDDEIAKLSSEKDAGISTKSSSA